jgi:transposase
MANPKRFTIKEDMRTLRQELRRGASQTARSKLRVLILYKEHEQQGISKHQVARALGVDPGSALRWRNKYIEGGLAGLLSHKRKCNRPSVIKPEQREPLREKLHEPDNGLRGFTEMVAWFNSRFNADVKYNTMNKFAKRHYGAQSKVARKSHVKKDQAAVATLKKTSRSTARS